MRSACGCGSSAHNSLAAPPHVPHSTKGYVKAGDVRLLEKVARTHAQLIGVNQSSEAILAAAAAAADRQDFERRLVNIQEGSD